MLWEPRNRRSAFGDAASGALRRFASSVACGGPRFVYRHPLVHSTRILGSGSGTWPGWNTGSPLEPGVETPMGLLTVSRGSSRELPQDLLEELLVVFSAAGGGPDGGLGTFLGAGREQ